jgi:hypothetical protein
MTRSKRQKPERRWEEVSFQAANTIQLVQGLWRTPIINVMNLRVRQKKENFFTTSATISFIRQTYS